MMFKKLLISFFALVMVYVTAITAHAQSSEAGSERSPYDDINLADYEQFPWFKQFRSFVCQRRVNDTRRKLVDCVTVNEVREHQQKLQEIADENGGIRASGTPGFDRSVDYVVFKLRRAGYDVTRQPFEFTSFTQTGPSRLAQNAPAQVLYVENTDYTVMSQSEAGNVTGMVTAVDLDLGLDNASSSGCEPEDFTGFPAGHIALIQRGACAFQQKAENASAAGAIGVVIFNQGNADDRKDLINATLGAEYSGGIPVVFATYDLGVTWSDIAGLEMHLVVNVLREVVNTFNVFAESKHGNPDNVVMVGAHLDSVIQGPGIQDNGTGSAAILEVAEQMARTKTKNKVRFAWWGAEESGLIGSDFYIANLSDEELAKIALYLNFDMIGSPNFVRFIYDGDGSTFGLEGPQGSAAIEEFFQNFYERRGLAYEDSEISFRSDYAAFFDNGIPFGGLFTGAEGLKTPEQAAIYGGTAGEQYDPCYHQACDIIWNINYPVLNVNSDAVAAATMKYAMSTQDVSGGKSSGDQKAANAVKLSTLIENRGHYMLR